MLRLAAACDSKVGRLTRPKALDVGLAERQGKVGSAIATTHSEVICTVELSYPSPYFRAARAESLRGGRG
jgi:hypothetical protein